MSDIVLVTLNARYAHASFGLRYLLANMGDLRARTTMLEFEITQRPVDIAERILAQGPRIVGLGVYIWNARQSLEVAQILERIGHEIILVIGGPEVSYETQEQAICELADYVITGEADLEFARLCGVLMEGQRPPVKIIAAGLPTFEQIALPYDLYDEQDIAHRVIYVEASRGCPFKCEFCLSSLDVPVRNVPLDRLLAAMQGLLDRGVNSFKFVDRTFNLNLNFSRAILAFFMERYRSGLFLHFEMIPDRLPEALRDLISQFPAGALQFEVGVQSLNDQVCALISRRQDVTRLADNLSFLRNNTGVHVHADLIVGLPGEDMASFAVGFDRLLAMKPQEIQVGMLKRLRGTPIIRHDEAWGMVYSAEPPYEILQTRMIDFRTMQRLRRFSRYWDLLANSGNFVTTLPMVWEDGSAFGAFMALSDWLFARAGATHQIALQRLAEMLMSYLVDERGIAANRVAKALWADYRRGGRHDKPGFLLEWIKDEVVEREGRRAGQVRQARHGG